MLEDCDVEAWNRDSEPLNRKFEVMNRKIEGRKSSLRACIWPLAPRNHNFPARFQGSVCVENRETVVHGLFGWLKR
jgi:hypothetical protein